MNSTFAILSSSDKSFAKYLMLALKCGAIPIIVSEGHFGHGHLPFDEVLDWNSAAIRVQKWDLQVGTFILIVYTKTLGRISGAVV